MVIAQPRATQWGCRGSPDQPATAGRRRETPWNGGRLARGGRGCSRHNIFFPYFLSNSKNNILLGYLVGDGCFKFPQITATTISPYMAFQLYEICIRLKIPMSLKRFENKIKFKEIRGKVYPLKPFFWGLKINNLYSKKLLLNYTVKQFSIISLKN